jgi:hypothetical protein
MTSMDEPGDRRLAPLARLIGSWVEQVDVAGAPAGRMDYERALHGRYLLQRSTIPDSAWPDSLTIIAAASDGAGFTQHYFDSRDVTRLYAMTRDDRSWT